MDEHKGSFPREKQGIEEVISGSNLGQIKVFWKHLGPQFVSVLMSKSILGPSLLKSSV